ncbi:MAG: transcription elongation factor GreB [Bdellovibrionaceae bacterium]|nr:transcription elongation factor GreB [Bdellovibrionales bacterium]MCB9084258.1 transcription elongation factor GreB [Pseudobdellovibrionaceae bacterium]
MNSTPNYITPEGLEALKAEYKELFHVERPKLVETVAWAAGNGDRSENGDYIYGKKRLREIDRRLRFLGQRIDKAQIVDPKTLQSDKVVFGATVTLADEDGEEKTYMIVGEDEIDLKRGRISWKSPVARALLNKQVGDEVLIRKPAGDSYVEILRIEFC